MTGSEAASLIKKEDQDQPPLPVITNSPDLPRERAFQSSNEYGSRPTKRTGEYGTAYHHRYGLVSLAGSKEYGQQQPCNQHLHEQYAAVNYNAMPEAKTLMSALNSSTPIAASESTSSSYSGTSASMSLSDQYSNFHQQHHVQQQQQHQTLVNVPAPTAKC